MAGGVITAGLLGLGGSLLGAVGESQNQKQSFILQNAMANADHRRTTEKDDIKLQQQK
jgi:hypothetical protein